MNRLRTQSQLQVAAILQFDEKLHRNFLLFNEVPESEQSMPPRTTVPYFF